MFWNRVTYHVGGSRINRVYLGVGPLPVLESIKYNFNHMKMVAGTFLILQPKG
jgi:hypothetical protein